MLNKFLPQSLHAPIYMCIGMLMWAIIEDIPHFFSQYYTSFEIVWLRYSVHLLFMLVILGPIYRKRVVRTKRIGLQFVRGLLMMAMHLTFIFAVRTISVYDTMAGFWVLPFVVMLLGLWLSERLPVAHWLVTLAAFGGALLILQPSTNLLHRPALYVAGMAGAFGLYLILSRWMHDEDVLASLFYTAFSVWLVLLLGLPFYWIMPTAGDFLLMAAIGLIGYVCIWGFDKAVESAPAAQVAPFTLSQPLFALPVNFLLLGRRPDGLAFIGGLILTACLGFLAWAVSKKSPVSR